MSADRVALLGAVAGLTIFLGLPLGRLRRPVPRLQALLNAAAIGVLVFVLWDVLAHAMDPIEHALTGATSAGGPTSWSGFVGLSVVAVAGLSVGLVGLTAYDGWMRRRVGRRPSATGPGGHLALLIAVGIGLHNFAEGLAIGQSAASGELTLAVLLIIGFGLHNATEGFGIVAPLTLDDRRPTWGRLALLGLIGGGPTFLGTIAGQSVVSDALLVAFLALAAGSILYVVLQLVGVGFKLGHRHLLSLGVLAGLLAGFATDLVLVAAGT